MAKWNAAHLHLTHMVGRGAPVERLPETITGMDAAQRLLEEIAARYVERGCRVKNYRNGIRIYDCKNAAIADQSFEVHDCQEDCDMTASEAEYGRWTAGDRKRYLLTLEQRGLLT